MTSARAALSEVMQGLDAIDVDPIAKQKFLDLIGSIAATHGFDWMERANRVAFARSLLRTRIGRPAVRDRLMALYQISRPQAYRVISHALQPDHQ